MTSAASPDAVVAAVTDFFARHHVASLRLPSGWFGRPGDNRHQLTQARRDGDHVVIRLDGRQVLTLDAQQASVERHVLRIGVRGGSWHWTGYGGSREHEEPVGRGVVELHAPSAG